MAVAVPARAADWPQWRRDAQRSGEIPQPLPEKLYLQWVRQFPRPRPAWPEAPRLGFDQGYEPVVLGKTIFVPCNADDSLTALDVDSGEVRWRFFAEGPIRFAPVAWRGRVFFGSDDGYLYCLDAADGKLRWKFRGGPSARKVLGNGRLISTWPIRGGPVLHDDPHKGARIFFTAGIWPFMGVFVHSLDAESGRVVWTNDTSGSVYLGGKGGRGASPQGYLTVLTREQLDPLDRELGDVLIAPCGGSAPVLFDLHTGRLRHFGGFVPYFASEKSKARYKSAKNFGFKKGAAGGWFVNSPNVFSDEYKPYQPKIQCGARSITAENCPPVEGEVVGLLAAGGKLFITTDTGAVYCFGKAETMPRRHELRSERPRESAKRHPAARNVGDEIGFGVVVGAGDGSLPEELVRESRLDVIVVERDPATVERLRRRWSKAGWYGTRLHLLTGELEEAQLPAYLARLIVEQDENFQLAKRSVAALFQGLRPYGGTAWLPLSERQHQRLSAQAAIRGLAGANVARAGSFTLLKRHGPLPGAGQWTHEHGDASNTLNSGDERVRAPLGVLWFGGENARHHTYQADPILIAGGRMFMYTRDRVVAVDVYTGRTLWSGGVRAGGPLPCYAAASDAYYSGGTNKEGRAEIVKLNVVNGKEDRRIALDADWGPLKEIRVWKDFLIATTPSRVLAYDRRDLSLRWRRDTAKDIVPRLKVGYGKSRGGPCNHGLCVGGDKVFCIYGMTEDHLARLKRRGEKNNAVPVLMALDLHTGKTLWHKELDGSHLTWLAYSSEQDVLLQTADFRLPRHGQVAAYRGADGHILWTADSRWHAAPPPIVNAGRVTPQSGGAYELLAGKPLQRRDPITDGLAGVDYHRVWHFGGCNYAVSSRHLLTFRSGTAAYCDFSLGSGTGLLGGDRTGCRNSMITAEGLVNSPSISGCGCNFPIRGASMALVNDPDADAWTYFGSRLAEGDVRRLGVNFAAPGDRTSDDGTLWLEAPHIGGPTPRLGVTIKPENVRRLQVHPSAIKEAALPWVAASAAERLDTVTIPLSHRPPADSFSIRYQGRLRPLHSETYTFFARADDGVRVWLDGKLIIDAWRIPRAMKWTFPFTPYVPGALGWMTAAVPLDKDRQHDLKVEYFERDGGARLTLLWQSPSTPKGLIPRECLFTTDGKPGVTAAFFDNLELRGRSVTEIVPNIHGRWGEGAPPQLANLKSTENPPSPRHYTVRLHFAELSDARPGKRVLDVAINGRTVLRNFDVVAAAGGPRRAVVKEFRNVAAAGQLSVSLAPRTGQTLLSGVEVVRQP